MNKVNYGTNYNHRVTLRLNDEQHEFIIKVSGLLGVSPSDYIRMSINAGMNAMKTNTAEELENKVKGTVGTNENVKTNLNDIV